MVNNRVIRLSLPLNSSYLLETSYNGDNLIIYLPTLTLTSEMGAETVFIKNYADSQSIIFDSTNAYIDINRTVFTGGGYITLSSTTQYLRLISTRTSSGTLAWMCIGCLLYTSPSPRDS